MADYSYEIGLLWAILEPGTVTVDATGSPTTITGSGTSFTTDVQAGYLIHIDDTNEWTVVAVVNSNTSLTVSPALTQDATGSSFYAITMVNVETLASGAFPPPHHTYQKYSTSIRNSVGMDVGTGWKKAEWVWDYLSVTNRNTFKTAYCSGKGASVYIRTKDDSSVYHYYSALLSWPDKEEVRSGKVFDLTLTFQGMVEVL